MKTYLELFLAAVRAAEKLHALANEHDFEAAARGAFAETKAPNSFWPFFRNHFVAHAQMCRNLAADLLEPKLPAPEKK